MRRGALWLVLGGIALLAATIGYQVGGTGKSADSPRASTTAQSTIMGLVLVDAKGNTQRMDQWRGKVLVVNYWATWCFPCREEMPGFTRLQDKYKDKGVQFVGISIDDASKIIEFQKETPVNYPLLIGDMSTMAKSAELGNDRQALPFTAVFDREGKLAMSKLGRWHEADLEPKLADLILH
jgi:peroxiredoxin